MRPIIVAAALILVLAVGVNGQGFFTTLENVWAESLITTKGVTVGTDLAVAGTSALTGNTTVAGTLGVTGASTLTSLQVTGNANVAGNTVATGYIATSNFVYFIPPTTITVTDGSTITPTATFMELTAAGAVGAELAAAGDGQFLILVNVGAEAITITDTATTELTGNITLSATDSIMLIGSGIKWYQLAASDN
jgi:hypothetical protein